MVRAKVGTGVFLAVCALAACGDDQPPADDATPGGDGSLDAADGAPAECSAGRLRLSGMIEGRPLTTNEPITGRSLVQINLPGRYQLDFGSAGHLSAEIPTAASPGQRVSVTGLLELSAEERWCVAGDMAVDVEGFDRFEFTALSVPTGDDCRGAAIDGAVEGCADAS